MERVLSGVDRTPSRGTSAPAGVPLAKGIAPSAMDVTGHLATPRRWGTRVLRGGFPSTDDTHGHHAAAKGAYSTMRETVGRLRDLELLEEATA